MIHRQRLVCDVISDHHVHPDYSIDARGSLDEYCRAAMSIGLLEICFTTHYDADPARLEQDGFMVIDGRRERISVDAVRHYLDDVARVHAEYGLRGLMVRAGLEFGYFPGCKEQIGELLSEIKPGFRLGAVHSLDGLCLCEPEEARKLFSGLTLEQLADRYFETLNECAATGVFDCLAHIDIYRRFGTEYYGDDIMTVHRGRIEKVFKTMRDHQVGFEINTSAIRHGLYEYYPAMDIVNMARASGIPLVALGSDAHCPDDIALDFDAASTVAYELVPYVDE